MTTNDRPTPSPSKRTTERLADHRRHDLRPNGPGQWYCVPCEAWIDRLVDRGPWGPTSSLRR